MLLSVGRGGSDDVWSGWCFHLRECRWGFLGVVRMGGRGVGVETVGRQEFFQGVVGDAWLGGGCFCCGCCGRFLVEATFVFWLLIRCRLLFFVLRAEQSPCFHLIDVLHNSKSCRLSYFLCAGCGWASYFASRSGVGVFLQFVLTGFGVYLVDRG